MEQIQSGSLWIVKENMPARMASIGIQTEEQEKITIKKNQIIEFRYHYGVHFRTIDGKYCFVTEETLMQHCKYYGQILEKTRWENKTKLDEILLLNLYTPVEDAQVSIANV